MPWDRGWAPPVLATARITLSWSHGQHTRGAWAAPAAGEPPRAAQRALRPHRRGLPRATLTPSQLEKRPTLKIQTNHNSGVTWHWPKYVCLSWGKKELAEGVRHRSVTPPHLGESEVSGDVSGRPVCVSLCHLSPRAASRPFQFWSVVCAHKSALKVTHHL